MILQIFSLHILENPTQKCILRPPLLIFSYFESLIYFRLRNTFGAKPDFIKASVCPGYLLSIFIWTFSSVLELSLAIRLNIPLGIVLKVEFVCIFPPLIYLNFYFISDGIGIPVIRHYSKKIKVKLRESMCCNL